MKNSYFNTPRRSEDCTFHSWADPIHRDEPAWRKDPDTLIMAGCAAGFIFMVVYMIMGR